jgi:septal ring factor EnvC (AmiA/AmiB activator)
MPFRNRSHRERAIAVAIVATTFFMGRTATAQDASANPALRGTVGPGDLGQHDRDLGAIRAEQRRSAETTRKLEEEIDAIGEDRRKLSQSLIDAAARIRDVEE